MASALTAQAIVYPLPGTDDQQWYANGDVSVIKVSVNAGYAAGTKFGIYNLNTGAGETAAIEIFGANTDTSIPLTVEVKFESNGNISIDNVFKGNFGSYSTTSPQAYFGFYLDTTAYDNNPIWYSEESKNADVVDHLKTQTTSDPNFNFYSLNWEDLYGGGDKDYDDIVVSLTSPKTAPQAPDGGSTAALLGGAMLVLGGYRRLRR